MCVCVFVRTHRSAPTAGVIIGRVDPAPTLLIVMSTAWETSLYSRFVGADRCVCPLLYAFYILSPCLRGTNNRVAEGIYYVFAFFGRTHRSAPTAGVIIGRVDPAPTLLIVMSTAWETSLYSRFVGADRCVCPLLYAAYCIILCEHTGSPHPVFVSETTFSSVALF